MTNNKLLWQDLFPNTKNFEAVFQQLYEPLELPLFHIQNRLISCLKQLCHSKHPSSFMLLNAREEEEYFQLITDTVKTIMPIAQKPIGGRYIVTGMNIHWDNKSQIKDNFTAKDVCTWQAWVEQEQLFGGLYCYKDIINLQPGLVHNINGGILVIGAHTLVSQPLLWLRLKQMILNQRFDWLPANNNQPLSVYIPSMPINLRLIIIGEHKTLTILNNIDPNIFRIALYGEFELNKCINNAQDMKQWCSWVNTLAYNQGFKALNHDAWPELIKQAVRYSGDQFHLPLCPHWLTHRLKEAALYCNKQPINATALLESNRIRFWQESYLCDLIQQEITEGQIMVDTEKKITGQVNGLSVLSFSSHPLIVGQPSRISCVVYFGDGEINDIESKAELSGHLHTKGMMIMQAFLMSVLKLERQLPFSASLVFEQSYDEIDGDSASLAELVVLISALANQPIDQQIAITGSVDQFGRVQSIGHVNEKIECFFKLCQTRGLTGTQGVIIPLTNVRHLCLHDDVIQAVQLGTFSLWPVNNIYQALEILTAMPFDHEILPSLMKYIRERILQIYRYEQKQLPWYLRWLTKLIIKK
ncbi:AAA family ATPase [Candidatus Palibaumannia cicadellinicola]|uniref:endopeptidase La n=1 Tax=Baumannia cicadellinicola subsp. Homalodisca coagulata TaxID=374463 RepID=Q1LT60_BAUCH|nr:Lon protease family protein [Candidatus Baumannia cicadellinicola]ABF14235.1 conserved hypothetical protein [Baumannia cicadellinicola str. Hc (Homalodisca coagulata)]MBS0032820.1 Lon protease family protein [Candidatus Baumannia cicadellinicola]MBS0032835.1 Lon protease family protein [Candidatus Baumannia cicadellinicola]MCJ7462106.1 Lon protease family protein [Candidatus Baumannia cicadellinicola]MCJ7462884.1 Lon protease family protein [Candidatus Baumannia cicadellinicola]